MNYFFLFIIILQCLTNTLPLQLGDCKFSNFSSFIIFKWTQPKQYNMTSTPQIELTHWLKVGLWISTLRLPFPFPYKGSRINKDRLQELTKHTNELHTRPPFDSTWFSPVPRLAIICGHPRFKSTPSQYGSTNWAAFRKSSGSFAQNYKRINTPLILTKLKGRTVSNRQPFSSSHHDTRANWC